MNEVLLGIGIIFFLIVGIAVFARSPRGMQQEAADEAEHESPEELFQATHRPERTVEDIVKENETIAYDDR